MKKLIQKALVVAALAGAALTPLPAAAEPSPECLLRGGCFFLDSQGVWVCPDPSVYMKCVDMG